MKIITKDILEIKNSKSIHILTYLLLNCDEDGHYKTILTDLSKETGLSFNALKIALERLENLGFILVNYSKRNTNIQIINFDEYCLPKETNNIPIDETPVEKYLRELREELEEKNK